MVVFDVNLHNMLTSNEHRLRCFPGSQRRFGFLNIFGRLQLNSKSLIGPFRVYLDLFFAKKLVAQSLRSELLQKNNPKTCCKGQIKVAVKSLLIQFKNPTQTPIYFYNRRKCSTEIVQEPNKIMVRSCHSRWVFAIVIN